MNFRFLVFIILFCSPHEKINNSKEKIMDTNSEWQLIWEDNFEGNSLNTKYWNRQVEPAGRFNYEWQRYTADEKNAYVKDGLLVLEAIHESDKHGMNQYTSARLNTAQKFKFKYGKVVARIKLPKGKGIWPAFWMLGNNIDENGGNTPWPFCGEIDILELWGSRSNATVEANIHYANKDGKHEMMGAKAFELEEGIFADNFHNFELEWSAKELIWKVDGKTFATKDISDKKYKAFRKKFFFLLNIAVGGNYAANPDNSTPLPQKMYVDYIKVYQKK